MNEHGIKQFLSGRVPLSGRLSDYALLVGQNNFTIRNFYPSKSGNNIIGKKNPNRVGLAVNCELNPVPGGVLGIPVEFRDENGNLIWAHTLAQKEADVPSVTPSPFVYVPLIMTVETYGTLVQEQYSVFGQANAPVFASEIIMVPPCCEYIGGMDRTGWSQSTFDPKSNEPLER